MAEPISAVTSLASSGIFSVRGAKKVAEGEAGRIVTTAGQGLNVLRSAAALDNTVGRSALTAMQAIETVSKTESLLGYTAKGVNYVSRHVNPALGVVTAYKIIRSDNKERAVMSDGVGFGAMWGAEILFKAGARAAKTALNTAAIADPKLKLALIIAEGVAFAGVSIGSWILASKVGGKVYDSLATVKKEVNTLDKKVASTKKEMDKGESKSSLEVKA